MRGYLIDSHVLVWAVLGDARLSARAASMLTSEPTLFVSAASLWELAIKESLGRLSLPGLEDLLARIGVPEIPVTGAHARAVKSLPAIHGDPFDRILVAQAMMEDLVIVTSDPFIARYDVRTRF